MTSSRLLTAFAIVSSLGCARGDVEPAEGRVATNVESRAARAPGYTVHEWGLFALDVNASETVSVAAGVAHSAPSPGLGLGSGMGSAYKPVVYVHLDDGLDEQRFDLQIGLSPSAFVERWPGGTDLPSDVVPVAGGWRGVVARRGACTSPTPAPTSCASTPDGFCESTEIPRYYGDRDTCLAVEGASTDLLFYRTSSIRAAGLPMRATASGETLAVERLGDAAIEGPVLFITSDGATTHIVPIDPAALGGPIATTGLPEITSDAARTLLHHEAMRRGLSATEAEAFVDAWSPAYFAPCTRTGPEATGTIPPSLHQARTSLLHFAPRTAIDTMIPLRSEPPARATERVFLVRWVDARAPLADLAATTDGAGSLGGGPRSVVSLVGAPRVRGNALSADAIRRVVRRNLSQVAHCYERELLRDPVVRGRITMHATIRGDGTVADAAAEPGHIGSEALPGCVAGAFRRWRFPEPSPAGDVRFDATFTLSPP